MKITNIVFKEAITVSGTYLNSAQINNYNLALSEHGYLISKKDNEHQSTLVPFENVKFANVLLDNETKSAKDKPAK